MSTNQTKDTTHSRPWQQMIRDLALRVPRSTLSLAAYGVVVHQGKVTLVKHSQLGWMLPGGKVAHDSVEQSLLQWVTVQTGLKVQSARYFGYTLVEEETKSELQRRLNQLLKSELTLYFYAEAAELSIVPLSSDIVEVASVTPEEAGYLFRESAAELGVLHNHQEVMASCKQLGLLSTKPSQLNSIFVLPIKPADRYKLNIFRSFSSLYRWVKILDQGSGKKPYFEYDGKKIFLSMSER
jgi:hypothetical protein